MLEGGSRVVEAGLDRLEAGPGRPEMNQGLLGLALVQGRQARPTQASVSPWQQERAAP